MLLPCCFVNSLAWEALSGILRLPLQAQELGRWVHTARQVGGSFSYPQLVPPELWTVRLACCILHAPVPLSLPCGLVPRQVSLPLKEGSGRPPGVVGELPNSVLSVECAWHRTWLWWAVCLLLRWARSSLPVSPPQDQSTLL